MSACKFYDESMLTHAAALSYYMVFSLPPMLLVILSIAAQFYNRAEVRESIFTRLSLLVGESGARQVMDTLVRLNNHESTWWTTIAGFAVLLFFATTMFNGMRVALNKVIQMESADVGLWVFFRIRIIAFVMLGSISFLLIVSLALNTMIADLGSYLVQWFGERVIYVVVLDVFLLELALNTVLISLYFRYLPDVKLRWKDTWFGAFLTAALLVFAKNLITWIISNNELANLYDAAGSILILMLWVYYAMAIFLFGATFTFTRAKWLSNGRKQAT